MKPRLSIILTLYNINPLFVRDCLNSIQAQSFSAFKIIVIDDCSTVDYSWIKTEPNCVYIRNEQNLGLCKSVNKAFGLVDTEYCVRIGSDDLIETDFFEEEVKFLDCNENYIAVCSDLQKFGFSEARIKRPQKWFKQIITSRREIVPAFHGYGYAGGMMFRSSALKTCRINEEYSICEDFDFHLQLLEHGNIKSLHEPFYLYRAHATNYCRTFDRKKKIDFLEQILRKHGLYV